MKTTFLYFLLSGALIFSIVYVFQNNKTSSALEMENENTEIDSVPIKGLKGLPPVQNEIKQPEKKYPEDPSRGFKTAKKITPPAPVPEPVYKKGTLEYKAKIERELKKLRAIRNPKQIHLDEIKRLELLLQE